MAAFSLPENNHPGPPHRSIHGKRNVEINPMVN
jgi:hypothetical protein